MNRRRFLAALAAAGGLLSGLVPRRAGSVLPGPEGALGKGMEGYDRVISGRVSGFTVPTGKIWKIEREVESTANVIVEGTLVMRPGDVLRFTGIDESAFEGGGMKPLESDVGLWVIGDGVLDIEGSAIQPWNRTGADSTWTDDHEIVLMPWEPGDSGWDAERNTSTVRRYRRGDQVPEIVPGLPTEVVNLSRDARIEGTPGGRTHILIYSRKPQKIRHAAIRHVGPQKAGDRGRVEGVLGRYGLHFHMMGEASRGTLVEGVVIRDCGNHAFVPHGSHGITFRRCVAFDTFFEQFWWDKKDPGGSNRTSFTQTNDVVYEECIGALAHWGGPGYHGSNFLLGRTDGGAVMGCVAVGCQAWKEGSGFHWPSQANREPNIWKWENNLSHNHLMGGARVWQNTRSIHQVPGLKIYRCGVFGIANGAYGTPGYHWSDFEIVGLTGRTRGSGRSSSTGIVLHAVASASKVKRHRRFPDRADGYAHSFERGLIRDVQVGVASTKHVARPGLPTLIKGVAFEDIHDVVLLVDEDKGAHAGLLDFVECTRDGRPIRPEDVRISSTLTGFRARFQNGTDAWEMDGTAEVAGIEPFYPRLSR